MRRRAWFWVMRLVYIALLGVVFYLMERSFRKDKQQETDELEKLEEEIRRLKQQQGK